LKVATSPRSVILSTTSEDKEAEAVRRKLLDAVSQDDVTKIQELCKSVAELNLTLTDDILRDPEDRATVLHTALINDRLNVAKYLIESDEQLLYETYDIEGQHRTVCLKKYTPWCFITLANVDRFSEFSHQSIRPKIFYVRTTKISTSPAVCCYTTLWNSKIEKCYRFFKNLNVTVNLFN